MKKGIVFGLLAVVVIVLVSPGIVGRTAEGIVEQNSEWTATNISGSGVGYESESFERGWFTSYSEDRVTLTDPAAQAELVEALGLSDAAELPSLVISTRLDHGLIPITSLGREGGSLAPSLSRTVSTVSIEGGNGERIEIPGNIYGHIGFGGTFYSRYEIEGGSANAKDAILGFSQGAEKLGLQGELTAEMNNPEELAKAENMTVSWGAISIDGAMDPKSGRAQASGSSGGWNVESDDGFVRVGNITFNSDQTPNEYGVGIGDFDFAIDTVEVQEGVMPAAAFGPITMEAATTANGERVSGDMQMYFAATEVPGVGSGSVTVDISVTDIDAASAKSLTDQLNAMPDDISQDAMFAMLEPDLKTVLSSGFAIDFKQFDVELPQGTIDSSVKMSLPETDPADFSWEGILRAMNGSASLSVPEPLMDMALMMNPQAQMVVGMGFLKKNGDAYEMEALYEKGLLTVNGAPIPLPMP